MRLILDDIAEFAIPSFANGVELLSVKPLEKIDKLATGFGENVLSICTADAGLADPIVAAGGRRLPHMLFYEDFLENPSIELYFFRLSINPDQIQEGLSALQRSGIVPCHRDFGVSPFVIGIATAPALNDLAAAAWPIERLGSANLPETHDLYLMRDADLGPPGFADGFDQQLSSVGGYVLFADRSGLTVALPGQVSIETLHFPVTQHGHNLKLLPDLALINRYAMGPAAFESFDPIAALNADDASQVRTLIPTTKVAEIVTRLSGFADVDGRPIASRHIHHPDSARAVVEIERMLASSGLTPVRHQFIHEGRILNNVQAELVGETDELVLITAHLDSRAGRGEPDYDPAHDAAPGADDDASGVAAVVSAAIALNAMARASAPRRSIRFVLFHAEEHGLVGSRHYARAAAAADTRIAAVIQMDMIGFVPPASGGRFEIHMGCRDDPAVERRSEPIGAAVEHAARLLGELGPAEVYRSPADPLRRDPADGRSDHSSFHMSGYAAVIVSEDFFGGTTDLPTEAPNNPHYHSRTDTAIDASYAASIARIAALAAWGLAHG
jgi:bacterial leucyl aminopeptidase